MDRIIRKTVHGPADQCLVTLDRSYWRLILLRHPGEGRNLRMGHSVRHPDLLSPGVIRQRLHFAELQRDLALGRAAYGAYRRNVSVGVEGIHKSRPVPE